MRSVAAAAALLAVLTGCASSPTSLPSDFGEHLEAGFGCGDVSFFAVDSADTYLLRVHAEGLVAAAREAGAETITTFALPDGDIDVRVEVGTRISDAACDDVIENDGPRVDAVYRATAGSATITIRPDAGGEGARADLQLEGVVFEPEDGGPPVTLPTFAIRDTYVGWYPG